MIRMILEEEKTPQQIVKEEAQLVCSLLDGSVGSDILIPEESVERSYVIRVFCLCRKLHDKGL